MKQKTTLQSFYHPFNSMVTKKVSVNSMMLKSPLKADLYINYYCNSNCIHCYTNSSPRCNEEMSFETAKKAIDQLVDANVFYVVILGGEPLLHPNFFDILDYGIKRNLIIGLSTNATLITPRIAKLISERCKEVQVSLHASTPDNYKSIFNVNNFKKAINGITNLVKENVRVSINSTIMSTNINDVPSILDLAEKLKATNFVLNPFLPAGRGKNKKELMASNNQLLKLQIDLKQKIDLNNYRIELKTYSICSDSTLTNTNKWLELFYGNCQGRQMVTIDPEGNLTACSLPIREKKALIGNIYENTILYYWKNADLFKWFYSYKGHLKGRCKNCKLEFCSGCRALALIEHGDFFAEDPYCPNLS